MQLSRKLPSSGLLGSGCMDGTSAGSSVAFFAHLLDQLSRIDLEAISGRVRGRHATSHVDMLCLTSQSREVLLEAMQVDGSKKRAAPPPWS